MSNIRIIAAGKLKEDYLKNKASEYEKIIKKRNNFEMTELNDESIPKNAGEQANILVKEKEAKKILAHIKNTDYVAALCIDGKATRSTELKDIIERGKKRSEGDVVFVIGGSLGLDEKVIKRADEKISFSKMTFPHQLMRIMLLEQIAHYL